MNTVLLGAIYIMEIVIAIMLWKIDDKIDKQ